MSNDTMRKKLVGYFKDNATPTGGEFKELIESVLIQDDDKISIDENAVNITGKLKVSSEISINGEQAILSRNKFKVGEHIAFDETNGLQVNCLLSAKQGLEVDGPVNINSLDDSVNSLTVAGTTTLNSTVTINAEQHVTGNVHMSQVLNLGSETSAGKINLEHQGDTSSLLIKNTTDHSTQLCLTSDGKLSLGLAEDEAQAKLHIYNRGSSSESLFKVDNSAQDTRPFIIKGDGRVGVSTDSPENELDVAGSVRIGSTASTMTDKYSLSVEDNIGIGTIAPNARVDIHAKENETGLKVNYGLQNPLTVSQGLVTTDAETVLDIKGDAQLKSTLTVDGLTSLEQTKISQQLVINKNPQNSHQPAAIINTQGNAGSVFKVIHEDENDTNTVLNVKADKVGILCDSPETDFHVAGETQIDGNTHLKKNLAVTGSINVQADVNIDQTISLGLTAETKNNARLHIALPNENQNIHSVSIAGTLEESPTLTVRQDSVGIHTENPEGALDVNGNANFKGQVTINELVTVSSETLSLQQQGEFAAINIQNSEFMNKTDEDGNAIVHHGIQLTADSISLNANAPEANFHIVGSTKLEGITNTTELMINEELTVNAPSAFNDHVSVNSKLDINTLVNDDSIDVHLRQSTQNKTALRIDPSEGDTSSLLVKSGHVGINNNAPMHALDVQGSVQVSDALMAKGPLTVEGETRLKENALVNKNLGFSIEEPQARIHINNTAPQETALRIDSLFQGTESPLVFKQGMLGLGYSNPKVQLDVKGDANISDELQVSGQTKLEHTLQVHKDALFKSDMTVHKDSELVGQTVIGQVSEIDPNLTPNAQLYIADTRYKEALRIDSVDHASLVFSQGKLGIGKTDPRVALDVQGEMRISQKTELESELEVDGNILARNDISVGGAINVARRADIGGDTHIRGDLRVEDKTQIEEELTVTGNTQLEAELLVKQHATLEGQLDVSGDALFMSNAAVAGTLEVTEHLNVEQDALVQGQFRVDGNTRIDQQLSVNSVQADTQINTKDLNVSNNLTISNDLNISNNLQIKNGPLISSISEDSQLGGESSLHSVLPTQAAVKAYIDSVAVPFAQGGRTYTVHNQRDFDEIFNKGNTTTIAANTTIILMPLNLQQVGAYTLKNSVSLREGTSIVGFNALATRIVKQNANARFEIVGNARQPIKNIQLAGFCFDGANLQSSRDGSAFYLEHASHCQLNCRIENHTTWGDGGAIFAPINNGIYSVFNIEAKNIYNCRAMDQGSGSDTQLNEGGAAYGLARSIIYAHYCQAERGGAVAKCHDSQVEAYNCTATRSGGAAYRCTLLRLLAKDCSANMQSGKGGAAYLCSDLLCEGLWTGNNAAEAPHIYASNHLTDLQEERHYWQGNFVGRRIDDDVSVWRSHNE
jgi:cytoskeletal protein CcmA (bactofilin family)